MVTGDVTAFGRKVTGDQQLFGILGRSKEQVAYAKVDLNVVDVATSEVVYSTSGAGEYALSNREVIGFGGTAGYDSTLNGKVLDLAIREASTAWSRASSKAPGNLPSNKGSVMSNFFDPARGSRPGHRGRRGPAERCVQQPKSMYSWEAYQPPSTPICRMMARTTRCRPRPWKRTSKPRGRPAWNCRPDSARISACCI